MRMRCRQMVWKEFIQFRRSKVMLRMAIFLPLVQTFVLAWAANTDVLEVPLSVFDEDVSPRSRELVQSVAAGRSFRLVADRVSSAEIERDLDAGIAQVALHIPRGFSRSLDRGDAVVQVLVDGSDSVASAAASAYLQGMVTAYGAKAQAGFASRRGMTRGTPAVRVEPRIFYNPDLRSRWFMAPAVMALVLTVLMQNLTALAVARERELGTFEQLVMTPIRPVELLMGKLTPFGLIGCIDALLVGLLVVFALGVPFRGSVWVLGLATLPFLIAVLGLGLVISTMSANQQQAQLTSFFFMFPSILLSGFVFPVENMPTVLQWISKAIPMTYYLEVVRGSFMRGSGFGTLVPQIAGLCTLAVFYFGCGVVRFRKRLD